MRLQLERYRLALQAFKDQHEPMAAAIEQHLNKYDDALQPPLRRQLDWIHQAQRLSKLCVSKAYEKPSLIKDVLNAKDPSWSAMPELAVDNTLKERLAEQLFLSSGAASGEKIIIATTADGRDIAEHVVVQCLRNNVDFELGIKDSERMMYLINELNEEGLQALTDLNMQKYAGVHREIIISSSSPQWIKEQIDKTQMDLYKKLNKEIHDRAMGGDLHYTLTRIPNERDAEMDGMDHAAYLQLFFELCDQPWEEIEQAQGKLINLFDEAKIVEISNADGTHLTLDISGQTFANSVIAKNIPGSEIFSSPLRDKVDGTLVSKGKFHYGSSGVIENITIEFVDGRVESFTAEKGQEDLEKIITADDEHGEGTRHVGELGIGTNPHLRQHVLNSLLVEKIGGSFHLALGASYSYTEYLGTPVRLDNGNRSHSGIHWDMTTMLRGKDGKMFIDGELIQENGEWIGDDYLVLNDGWSALAEEDRPDWWKERYPNGYDDQTSS